MMLILHEKIGKALRLQFSNLSSNIQLLTLYRVLLRIKYHTSCLKSDVMAGRRIIGAPVSLYFRNNTTVTGTRSGNSS